MGVLRGERARMQAIDAVHKICSVKMPSSLQLLQLLEKVIHSIHKDRECPECRIGDGVFLAYFKHILTCRDNCVQRSNGGFTPCLGDIIPLK